MGRGARGILVGVLVLLGLVSRKVFAEDFGGCGDGEATSFLMGFMGHSGSTAIMSILHKHSKLQVAWPQIEPMESLNSSTGALWTENFFADAVNGNLGIPGFKLRPNDVGGDLEKWSNLVGKYKTRFVRMVRENVFKAGAGLYSIRVLLDRAAVQGLHPGQESHCEESPDSCYFEVSNIKFLAFLMHVVDRANKLVEAMQSQLPWECSMTVTYEDFVRNGTYAMNTIYSFLGVPFEDHSADFSKALPDSPCVVILNYQDVCATLWGCEQFRPYLEDAEHGCFCSDKERPKTDFLCDEMEVRQSIHRDPSMSISQLSGRGVRTSSNSPRKNVGSNR